MSHQCISLKNGFWFLRKSKNGNLGKLNYHFIIQSDNFTKAKLLTRDTSILE